MEKASKLKALFWPGSGKNRTSKQPEIPPIEPPPEPPVQARRHDRWFVEKRGGKAVAKRLNIPNEVLVTAAGPLEMKGNITLVDENGQRSQHQELRLCRCGASQNKPLCDERHVSIEFFDRGAVTEASSVMPVKTPQSLLVTLVKDGPVKFSGYLRIHNARGQECLKRGGALCRCGRSARKPFCDCQ
jgi:CDGSH-type Zn-finger protein